MIDRSRRKARAGVARGFRAPLFVALVLAIVLPLGGCEDGIFGGFLGRFLLKTDEIVIERNPDAVYEELFPRYVELCALSQPSRKEKSRGNPFGHALMYLKGACKDENAPFPLLRQCRHEATTLDDPEHGAGVSVGRWFSNVNLVAVPGYRLFFEGNLKPGQTLSPTHFDATVQNAIERGVFAGVELQPEWTRREGPSLTDFVANGSIGTDFALRYSRNVFCARTPVTEPVMNEIIAFLNDKNREYATGEANYNWSLFANNCVHTIRNALAAANMWTPLTVLDVKWRHLFNLAVPANEFVNMAQLVAEGPFADISDIQAEGPLRDSLHDFHWLPTSHGALLKTMPVHQPNVVFDPRFRLFTVQSPFSMGKTLNAVRLLSDKRFTDLKTNLLYYRDRYDKILARQAEPEDPFASVRGSPYRRAGRIHHDYIEAQRRDVQDKLDRMAAMEAPAEPEVPGDEPAPEVSAKAAE